jgi:hypothetical protein
MDSNLNNENTTHSGIVLICGAKIFSNHVCGQHEEVSARMKALTCSQISNSFASKLIRTHHFDDIESCPRYIVAAHLKLKQKQ